MTLGCNKYRFNRHAFGDIGGIPRLLDIGQCNDSYSAIRIATALADAFECGVNDLPLSLVISWFEQKAAAVLLTLLALGIRNIRLGPTLPAFVTPGVLAVLVDQFGIQPIGDAGADLAAALARRSASTASRARICSRRRRKPTSRCRRNAGAGAAAHGRVSGDGRRAAVLRRQ